MFCIVTITVTRCIPAFRHIFIQKTVRNGLYNFFSLKVFRSFIAQCLFLSINSSGIVKIVVSVIAGCPGTVMSSQHRAFHSNMAFT